MTRQQEGTTLNLLTREGAVTVSYPVELTEEQYAKLYECVSECDTKQELRECIAMIANEWGIEPIIDEG
jgi:hypothetical protein